MAAQITLQVESVLELRGSVYVLGSVLPARADFVLGPDARLAGRRIEPQVQVPRIVTPAGEVQAHGHFAFRLREPTDRRYFVPGQLAPLEG